MQTDYSIFEEEAKINRLNAIKVCVRERERILEEEKSCFWVFLKT